MLVYDDVDPRNSTALQRRRGAGETTAPRGPSVRYVLALLRRRALLIASCAILGTGLAFAVGKMLTPRYTAEAQLYIDPRDLRLLDKELTAAGQDSGGFLTIVESQAQVITSSNVLGRVVRALDLTDDPEFVGGGAAVGPLAALAQKFGQSPPPAPDAAADFSAALDALSKRIAVRRTGRTFIVDVEATSRDADKAARIANAVVDSYLAEEVANRAEAANRASAGLSSRLVELREDVNRAESRVQAYKAENGLIGTRDVLVTDQQLTQLNAQLAGARVRAADAQARVDQVQRMQAAGIDAGATEDALASQAITALRTQYAELSRKQAELAHDLGPRHPQVTSIASQLQLSRRLIDQEIARYAQAAKTDLARAQATVTSLEKSFDAAKGKTVGLAQASIRLRELDREVDASRAVYEAFLVRARETGQQARLDVSNARIITQAVKPLNRSYPPPARTLAMLGLVAGLLLGIALALAEEWLKGEMRASREAGDSTLDAISAARRRRPNAVTIVGGERLPATVGGYL
ncbi:GumC family protein [Methylobacterium sp. C25]|uniref:GumC family protein n=1 Tax=Methylobacterium sp. C25 TaxID=2721622 RepID=UPI001F210DFC|nr:GumC family protein [Methylobacterium sp. C25]MCE4222445.1 GumC family protein [Methylobacterium sp. C25]